MSDAVLLRGVGRRVRSLRSELGWSRRALAERTRLSERFLSQVEGGTANPSILSLSRIALALGVSTPRLLEPTGPQAIVALLGLRGAGKSSVGRLLASRLGRPFVELDARVEESAGLSLAEIFELHGEDSYRRRELAALGELVRAGGEAVLATGGGIVAHAESFDLLRRHATTVWLRATPQEHWDRVVAQGDHRPMANDPLAMEQLQELLARREPLYSLADHEIATSGRSPRLVAEEIARRLAR